ncbi:MAPEG family protein [bacterium]|nr:MAPEG family protein [bacterium]
METLAVTKAELCFLSTIFAMFVLANVVLFRLAFARDRGVKAKQVSMDYYKLFNQGDETEGAIKAKRNLANLFEMPVFFYAAVIVIFITHRLDPLFHGLAWAYVGLRVVHTLIHLTFNHVMLRFAAFLTSNIILIVMWIRWYLTILNS